MEMLETNVMTAEEAEFKQRLEERLRAYVFKNKTSKQRVASVVSISIKETMTLDGVRRIKTGTNALLELLGLESISEVKEVEYIDSNGKTMRISGAREYFAHDDQNGMPEIVYLELPTFTPWGRKINYDTLSEFLIKNPTSLDVKSDALGLLADQLEVRTESAILDDLRVYKAADGLKVWTKHDETLWNIPQEWIDGCTIYEYSFSAAAKLRSKKGGIFVNTKMSHNDAEIAKFEHVIPDIEELRGADVVLNRVMGFEWSRQFKGKLGNASKVVTRAGLALSNSSKIFVKPRLYMLGEICMKFTEAVEGNLRTLWGDNAIDTIKKDGLFKEAKWDGMGICRATFAIDILKAQGFNVSKMTQQDVIGKAILHRLIPGTKGLLYIVADEELDKRVGPNGEKVYEDADIILEENSVKYIADIETLDLDYIHIIRFSKTNKFSRYMNFMYWLGLDTGFETGPRSVIDKIVGQFNRALTSPTEAKALLNMVDDISASEELGIDAYETNLNTTLSKIIDADEKAIFDPLVRSAMISTFSKVFEYMSYGRIPLDAACRFIVTDPSAFFLTHRMVPALSKDGKQKTGYCGAPLYNIIIEDHAELLLSDPSHIYWNHQEGDALLFRSPMTHPGQIAKVQMVNKFPEILPTPDGGIKVSNIIDTTQKKGDCIILNGCNVLHEMAGGADDDGDTELLVKDGPVVRMRSPKRSFCIPEDSAGKAIEEIIYPAALKKFLLRSLQLNMVGLLTNYGVAWRDLELHVRTLQHGETLPFKVMKGLSQCAWKAQSTLEGRNLAGYGVETYTPTELKCIREITKLHTKYSTKPGIDLSTIRMNRLSLAEFNDLTLDIIWACEAACSLLASLQMVEIDSAKTQKGVDTRKYPFLSNRHSYIIDYQTKERGKCGFIPDWHKEMQDAKWGRTEMETTMDQSLAMMGYALDPGMLSSSSSDISYKSQSVMGTIKDYVARRHDEFITHSMSTSMSKICPEWAGNRNLYIAMNTLKRKFADEMFKTHSIEDDDYRLIERKQVMNLYNALLHDFAISSGLSNAEMTSLIYTCSVSPSKNYYHRGFLLYTWSNEFIMALRQKKADTRTSIIHVSLLPEYIHMDIVEGEYMVKEKFLFAEETPIGKVSIADGVYRVFSHFGHTYLETVATPTREVENLPVNNFNGTIISVICDIERSKVIDSIRSWQGVIGVCEGTNDDSQKTVTAIMTNIDGNIVKVGEIAKFVQIPGMHKKYFKVRVGKVSGLRSMELIIETQISKWDVPLTK